MSKTSVTNYLGDDPMKVLERQYAEAQKIIIALVEAAGGEVFIHDDIVRSVYKHDYELTSFSSDPLQRSITFRTKRSTKVWP